MSAERPRTAAPGLVDRAVGGDRAALARLLTLLETGGPDAAAALRALYPRAGRAHVVGLTGPPGSGKSTLAAALARLYRARGDRVAILAVDPTSPRSGGALLGDRVRLQDLTADAGVFVRSVAARGGGGALAAATPALVAALDAAGYTRILLETVGAGQDEVAVAQLAQTTVVVTVPGLGDQVQVLKAGLLEVADVLVVNKADRPDAEQARADLELLRGLAPTGAWEPPVVATVAPRGEGVPALAEAVEAHRAFLATQPAAPRARARARAAVLATARALLEARLERLLAAPAWEEAIARVAQYEQSPCDVAQDLVAALGAGEEA